MDETAEYMDESFDESFDEMAEADDESYDEMAEFLPGLPIPGLGSVLGGVASGIGNLLGAGAPRRAPLPSVRLPTPSSGVTNATLNTPAGSATLALPSPLVRQDEFRATTQRLQEGINRNTSRLNTVAGDLSKLRTDFIRIETDTRNQVAKLRTDTRKALVRARKQQAATLARLRREQSSQQMMSMMMAMLTQRQIQDQLEAHTHPPAVAPATGAGPSTNIDTGDNSMLMLLPLMMMQDSGGSSSDNNMMMPMMMMMAFR
jgi:hypothetical protein